PAHSYSHSFPTRRSSDLLGSGLSGSIRDFLFSSPGFGVGLRLLSDLVQRFLSGLADIGVFRFLSHAGKLVVGLLRIFVTIELFLDRKSTRLNSSHSQISY